jgi:hypothetical protein
MTELVVGNNAIVGQCVVCESILQHYLIHIQGEPASAGALCPTNANDSLAWPSVEQQDLSEYSEGHLISAVMRSHQHKKPRDVGAFCDEATVQRVQKYPPLRSFGYLIIVSDDLSLEPLASWGAMMAVKVHRDDISRARSANVAAWRFLGAMRPFTRSTGRVRETCPPTAQLNWLC